MNKKSLLLVAILFLAVGFAIFHDRQAQKEVRVQKRNSAEPLAPPRSDHQSLPPPPPSSSPSVSDSMPLVEEEREDVIRDPEGLPVSIGKFSEKLADLMEIAMDSEKDGVRVFGMLEECALKEDKDSKDTESAKGALSYSARAMCAYNASRLSSKYPEELGAQWQDLEKRLPERIAQVVSLMQE